METSLISAVWLRCFSTETKCPFGVAVSSWRPLAIIDVGSIYCDCCEYHVDSDEEWLDVEDVFVVVECSNSSVNKKGGGCGKA